jgi:hypothetical protein
MKVLLRHLATGLFCGDAFQWVKDANYAKNFETRERAEEWVASRQLSRMEVVVANGDSAHPTTTPLTSAKAAF